MPDAEIFVVKISDAEFGNEITLFRTEESADAYVRKVTARILDLDTIPPDADCQDLLNEEFENSRDGIPEVGYYLCKIND